MKSLSALFCQSYQTVNKPFLFDMWMIHLSLMLNPSSTLPLDFTDNDYGCVDSLSGAISFTTRPLLPSPASLFCACVHACARDRLACALPYIVVVPLGFTEKHM